MSDRVIRIAFASDNGYARPLAVAGRSVIRHLTAGRQLEIYVLDLGITEAERAHIAASWEAPGVSVHWIGGLADALRGLPAGGSWISNAAYARLLLPDVLPEAVDRVLYLDCDLVVRRCVGPLFDSDFDGAVALAVPDMGCPFVGSLWGVGGWFEAGRTPGETNFNTGVLLIDVAAWRRDQIGRAALDYARSRDADRPLFVVDQEALNATAGRRIRAADPHWNQQTELFSAGHAAVLPYPRDLVDDLRRDGWVIHYSLGSKPWQPGCTHPWADEWYANLADTDYRGWHPPRLPAAMVRLRRTARDVAGRSPRLRRVAHLIAG